MLEAEIKPNWNREGTRLWMKIIMSTENPVALLFPKMQFEGVLVKHKLLSLFWDFRVKSNCLSIWQAVKIDDIMVSS